jgi:hypothetical protein
MTGGLLKAKICLEKDRCFDDELHACPKKNTEGH